MKINKIELETIDSTNTYGLNYKGDKSLPLVIISKEQTQGKGKYHRTFYSQKDCGLYFSLVFRPKPEDLPYLIYKSSLAIFYALEKRGYGVSIKWYNDILMNGKKLSGILMENKFIGSTLDRCVIGIGINTKTYDYPKEIKDLVIALDEVKTLTDTELIHDIISYILNNKSNKEIIDEYNTLCSSLSKKCVIENIEVIPIKVEYDGRLLALDKNNQKVYFNTGEITQSTV